MAKEAIDKRFCQFQRYCIQRDISATRNKAEQHLDEIESSLMQIFDRFNDKDMDRMARTFHVLQTFSYETTQFYKKMLAELNFILDAKS